MDAEVNAFESGCRLELRQGRISAGNNRQFETGTGHMHW